MRADKRFRVLRQALGYSVSVTVARPREGLRLLQRMVASGDPDAVWIVRENLKNHRLASALPAETETLARSLR